MRIYRCDRCCNEVQYESQLVQLTIPGAWMSTTVELCSQCYSAAGEVLREWIERGTRGVKK